MSLHYFLNILLLLSLYKCIFFKYIQQIDLGKESTAKLMASSSCPAITFGPFASAPML
ncbi:hypothetical protein HanPSC8_Chr16g0746891 [Helianthus annuus]|nr:hypothetical protein HanPSC8_Chr16g0746891 [Helianthus annuus]